MDVLITCLIIAGIVYLVWTEFINKSEGVSPEEYRRSMKATIRELLGEADPELSAEDIHTARVRIFHAFQEKQERVKLHLSGRVFRVRIEYLKGSTQFSLQEITPKAEEVRMNHDPDLADDVAAASAAYLFNVLPEILKLPASERYARLAVHFEACLCAYKDGLAGWVPEPSKN